jgi:prevent-host-death family protein
MLDLREVRSVTEFQRNLKDYVVRIKKNKTPLVLTVNGRAEIVVQDADSYQAILDRLERAETAAAIRQGMEQFEPSEGIPLDQAEWRLRRKHGFSRSDFTASFPGSRRNRTVHQGKQQLRAGRKVVQRDHCRYSNA